MKTGTRKLEKAAATSRSVLECGSPLPLSIRMERGGNTGLDQAEWLARTGESARGLAQSKTWRMVATLLLLLAFGARAQEGPGFALRFDGSGNYVAVPHTAGLNAFPLTVMAWVQTTQNADYQGLVNKYAETTFNGWNLFLRDGRVRAWYFVNGSRFVWDGGDGLDGGFVADGAWHHVAFVVDSTGASLYVDGVNRASRGSTGPSMSRVSRRRELWPRKSASMEANFVASRRAESTLSEARE